MYFSAREFVLLFDQCYSFCFISQWLVAI